MKLKQLIAIVLVLGVIAVLGFLYNSKQLGQTQPPTAADTAQQDLEWQEEIVSEIGLTLKHPKELVFRKEIADDNGRIRTVGFFLTKGSENAPEYQMYGLYQQFKDATQQDLELAKREMDVTTIETTNLAGYSGIEGLVVGPKTRFITTVIKDGKLFSVSTMPPTTENKELSSKILESFSFE